MSTPIKWKIWYWALLSIELRSAKRAHIKLSPLFIYIFTTTVQWCFSKKGSHILEPFLFSSTWSTMCECTLQEGLTWSWTIFAWFDLTYKKNTVCHEGLNLSPFCKISLGVWNYFVSTRRAPVELSPSARNQLRSNNGSCILEPFLLAAQHEAGTTFMDWRDGLN